MTEDVDASLESWLKNGFVEFGIIECPSDDMLLMVLVFEQQLEVACPVASMLIPMADVEATGEVMLASPVICTGKGLVGRATSGMLRG